MHRHDLFGRNAVAVDDDVAGKVRNGDHAVRGVHARTFDGVDLRIDVLAAAVVFRGVHVHDERLARHALGGDAGVVGEPVVGVDHVELPFEVLGDLRGHHGVTGHLLHEVGAVLSRKGVTLFPCVGRGPDLLTRFYIAFVVDLVLFGGDVGHHVRVDVDERHFFENVVGSAPGRTIESLHVAGVHYVRETLIFIAVSVGNHERDVYVVARQTARHAVARRSKTARDVGRELPTEH